MFHSPTRYQNVAAAATAVVKATPGVVYSVYMHNSNAAVRYLQLFDLAVEPTTTVTVPTFSFAIPATSGLAFGTDFFTLEGVTFATGIAWAVSTTRDVYTAGTNTEQQTIVLYA